MGEDKRKKEDRLAVLASVQGHDSTVAHAFNHTEGKCPKCGFGEHMLMFCVPGQSALPRVRGCELDGEHLHRMCGACKYPWVERCLDQAMLAEGRGEMTAESEIAAALASVVHLAGGLRLERGVVGSYRGWIIRFERDGEAGTITITASAPPPQGGQVVHPSRPEDVAGGAA